MISNLGSDLNRSPYLIKDLTGKGVWKSTFFYLFGKSYLMPRPDGLAFIGGHVTSGTSWTTDGLFFKLSMLPLLRHDGSELFSVYILPTTSVSYLDSTGLKICCEDIAGNILDFCLLF